MAEEPSQAQPEITDFGSFQVTSDPAEDMDLESDPRQETGDETGAKRVREEEEGTYNVPKKQKLGYVEEKSAEEERMENKNKSCRVKLGPKEFLGAVEMFDYFYKMQHFWPTDLDINKYEHMVLLDLILRGHPEPDKKIGRGIKAFQVRNHPMWKSRCFFLIREDETTDDFSFRKCVDHILPLPENMKINPTGKHVGGDGGSRRGGRSRGRGGKFRK